MKTYKINEVKQHLPEILGRIQLCKELADAHLCLYQGIINECVRESVNPELFGGRHTTQESVRETYRNYQLAVFEMKYLQHLVDGLKANFSIRNA